MKKFTNLFLALMLVSILLLPCLAWAEGEMPIIPDVPNIEVGEPLTWPYLATIGGAAIFTLLIVQFFKVSLDKIWKIPTRVFAYVVALAIMLVATAFTTGLTVNNALLVAVNAFLAAVSAYGAYEVTFAKVNK